MSASPFPALPVSQVTIPSNPLIIKAYEYVKEHTSLSTLNHCLRSTSFALIILRKFPPLVAAAPHLDTELVVLSIIMHDLGWATTKEILSTDKRFEVDGANLARKLIQSCTTEMTWDKHRLQLIWDAIALHTTPSIAHNKEPEVFLAQLGIMGDFFGPNIPLPGGVISIDEYKEVVTAFPRAGFKEEMVGIMCGLCRDKKETTFDNFVSQFGVVEGLDGKGTGREEYQKELEAHNLRNMLLGGLDACKEFE
ncbi:uncharacterized protein A1O9_07056 [Exophiala aquamarina CBS 119918]|uniref:HD domain-containing protein n=1 Tax=Exophiala aquamarina CBS 119918 TaxID=1182545 RepID=A0A072PAH8_9EURO|nr:uncharacterized protein A1O9_07056 [Exophiala aquamarina CBS 119918]KEF56866.1 hypothetical protein A1O9_07056 [Exophiala aquamarina CBS 119918]